MPLFLLKELLDCLKNVGHYANIVARLEKFIKTCTENKESCTQVYECFAQCLIEYLRYFKEQLNNIGCILVRKGFY